jgi:hypothetical protein
MPFFSGVVGSGCASNHSAMEPGAVASEVARAAGIHSSQLFRWRQQLCERRRGPKLLAHILFSKYGLHLPLNKGIDLDVSTLADWVGAAARR